MLLFNLCDAVINGSGILAQNASISSSNSLEEVRSVGKRGISSISPNGPIRNVFNYSYIVELNNEQSYNQVNLLKNLIDDNTYTGITLEIGGITGFNCYLDSYSIAAQPNDFIRANAVYSSYLPLSGSIHVKNTGVSYNAEGAIANGWSVFVTNSGNYITGKTAGFNYDFQAEWQAIYIAGKTYPVQVSFLGGSDKLSFTKDNFTHIQHSGQNATGFIGNGDNNIDLYQISIICTGGYTGRSLTFDVSGRVNNTNLDISVDNYLRSNVDIVNFY